MQQPQGNNKRFDRIQRAESKLPEEEHIKCVSCPGWLVVRGFRTGGRNLNDNKTVFKCKNCGRIMLRFEVWPQRGATWIKNKRK